MNLPLLSARDVVIFGGTTSAVAAALNARRAGLDVLLFAPRPYLGEDVCAYGRYWQDFGRFSDCVGQTDPSRPPRPMAVKHGLEQALIEAGVDFFLNAHPAGLLVSDDSGCICGAVFAAREGRRAVSAGWVVDAGLDHAASRTAGVDLPPLPQGKTEAGVMVLGLDGDLPPFSYDLEGELRNVSAKHIRCQTDLGSGSVLERARAWRDVLDQVWEPGALCYGERADFGYDDAKLSRQPLPGLTCLAVRSVIENLEAAEQLKWREERSHPEGPFHVKCADGIRGLDWLQAEKLEGESVPDAESVPFLGEVDVVVVGGGTGGAPAAIAAGRAGATVVVVEAMPGLGGVGTMGQIARYWYGNRVGFTSEVDRSVRERESDPDILAQKDSWSPANKAAWLLREQRELGVLPLFGCTCIGVSKQEGRVDHLLVAGPHGIGAIRVGAVVDASGNADVVAAAGGETVRLGERHLAVQGTGLAGVNERNPYHNSDHGFCNDSDLRDTTRFLVESKTKFRDHFDAGQLVDTRERRQIIGEVRLEPVDFLYGRRYPDTVCTASSNFDSHGFTIHPVFLVQPPDEEVLRADVPLRAFLPGSLTNVLATGLGLSAHRDALPVVRMQADVQNHGYAAGHVLAKQVLLGLNDVREVSVEELQQHLVEIGNLEERVLSESDSFPLTDEALAEAVNEELGNHRGISACFAEPERSVPLLQQRLRDQPDDPLRERVALILALLGQADGAELLRGALRVQGWDEGWNYRGMGQFGASMSRVDALWVGFSTVAGPEDWELWKRYADQLCEEPAFSHCRALTLASERLGLRIPADRSVAESFERILDLPGISGHAQTSLKEVQAAVTSNTNETQVRNRALRELYLLRGLWRSGDPSGRARDGLEMYARDLRSVFAGHATWLQAHPEPPPIELNSVE